MGARFWRGRSSGWRGVYLNAVAWQKLNARERYVARARAFALTRRS